MESPETVKRGACRASWNQGSNWSASGLNWGACGVKGRGWERCSGQEAAVAASESVAEAETVKRGAGGANWSARGPIGASAESNRATACGRVVGSLCGPRSSGYSVWERCRSGAWPRGSSCSVQERCRIVAEVRKQRLQRLGALQDRYRGREVAVAAPGNVAGALQRPGSSSCSVGDVDPSSNEEVSESLGPIQKHYYRYNCV